MIVVKRNGKEERLSFDKITSRIEKLCYNLDSAVDAVKVSQMVISGLTSGVTTSQIDQEAARKAAQMVTFHPHYSVLAARLAVADLHRRTSKCFSELVEKLHSYVHEKTGRHMPLVSDELLATVRKHKATLDAAIIHNRDMTFTYFGLRTLMRSYLLKIGGEVVESPQHMYMRVALGIHGEDIDRVLQTYDLLSKGILSHASPTMFNSGTPNPQMASCFLLQPPGDQDSIDSVYRLLHNCAIISKTAGGIGFSASTFRAKGSYIAGTNGTSNGLVPLLRNFNTTARYVDQGGNKRPGAFACYLEPWHADVFSWLELKLQGGKEEMRARDLFYALWVPDLFMRRVEQDGMWTLMCPHECPGLCDVWGAAFDALYTKYESEKRGVRVVRAQELWFQILRVQKETGSPYMLYKDACNAKSNQQNIGTIKQSNLCVAGDTEVLTEHGPQSILSLATAHETAKDVAEQADDRAKTEAHLQALRDRRALVSNERKIRTLESEICAIEAKLAALPEPAARKSKGPRPVKVWNGKAWSEVVPQRTAEKVPLIRITTSHGSVIDCTREHKFILADGATRVDAQALAIGSRLAPTPPVRYPGSVKYDLAEHDAFRRGYIYAYGVLKKGTDPASLAPRPPSLKVPCLVIPKDSVTKETLARLGYNEAMVRKQAPSENHELLAFVPVAEGEQALQTRTMAPEPARRAWVAGFMTACGGRLDEVRGSHSLLKRPRMMFRSVGEDARLSPAGRDGIWQMHWPRAGDDAVPVVTSIQDMGAVEDTYCFTEPDEHAGVFNDQLTGQCSEIVEYTAPDEIAVCNLASIALPKFVSLGADDGVGSFDFDELHAVVKATIVNMNRVIDRNLYMIDDMRRSNLAHRPVGVGVQGLADTFAMLRLPWEETWGVPHPGARALNLQIFETMYHAALEASCELAEAEGAYASYAGSPASQGKLQYDLWGVTPTSLWDWDTLRGRIAKHGLRNSLLLTCMPTASTAQILGNNESIEPFTTNMYTRKVLSGEFQVVNKYLVYELMAEGLWDDAMRQEIMAHSGSVQDILRIPKRIRDIFKTVWEISQQTLIDLAADRGAFICQSQSFNLHMSDPTDEQLSAAHFYGWERGLKTGMYYLRSKPATDAIKFTLDPSVVAHAKQQSRDIKAAAADAAAAATPEDMDVEAEERMACSRNNPLACSMCSA